MAKITAYTAASTIATSDVFIIDGTNGTRKITAQNLAYELGGMISAIQRRNIYRGASLGTSISSTQLAAIQAGTFEDMYIGDYWTINSVKWVIADMDYWYNCGDTSFSSHHLVMIPDGSLYSAQMNSSNTTEGGYVGSLMYTENLESAKETISTAFGDNLLTHREYLTNAVTDGHPSAGAWYDSTVDLMNEIMAYGTHVHAPANDGVTLPNKYTIGKQQLALFRLSPKAINKRVTIWLRDVVSAAYFARVSNYGSATCNYASDSYGVRPVFAVG